MIATDLLAVGPSDPSVALAAVDAARSVLVVEAPGAVTGDLVADAIQRILGFGVLAAATTAAAAVAYRWYSAEELPEGIGVLVGITVVAGWLNTRSALGAAIIGETSLFDPLTAGFTVTAFVASGIAGDGGRRFGDYLARDVFALSAPRTIDEVTQLVRSAGRAVVVTLPEEVEDAEGYDPVSPETKVALAGEILLLPRRLEREERRARLAARLERDYGVGHVDVELEADGTVTHLAVGSRPSGLGPTLAPGQVAVAIRADPAPDASSGDAVEVWRSGSSDPAGDGGGSETDPSPRCVASAELRAATGDVATVAVAADDADALVDDDGYRLVTLPGTPDAGREFVSALRAADESVTVARVSEDETDADGSLGAGLAGEAVGSLPVAVLAIERDDRTIALPGGETALEVGDAAYLLGSPETFRRLRDR